MKKFLYYLVYFVVAIAPFTLASCGGDDDDDEPSLDNGGAGSDNITLTINGKSYTFTAGLVGAAGGGNIVELWNWKNNYMNDWIVFGFPKLDNLEEGYTFPYYTNRNDDLTFSVMSLEGEDESNLFSGLVSGTVKVEKVTAGTITISFSNTIFDASYFDGLYGDKSFRISGRMTLPTYVERWGKQPFE